MRAGGGGKIARNKFIVGCRATAAKPMLTGAHCHYETARETDRKMKILKFIWYPLLLGLKL